MTYIEARVNARLRDSTSLKALVADEIRTAELGSTGPGVLASVVDTVPDIAFGHTHPVMTSRVQVTSWAKNFADVHEVARLVRRQLERWHSTSVRDTWLDNEHHFPPSDGWYEVAQDYLLLHTT